jgi:hypothetical protein
MPNVLDVARQPSGNDENGVDPGVVAVPHVARRQPFGGNSNAAQAVGVEGKFSCLGRGTRLDLDEGHDPAPARDKVDFAAWNPRPLREDPPAVKPQPQGRQTLRTSSAALSLLPLHCCDNSSALA